MSLDPVEAAHDAPAPTEDMPMTDESGKPKFPAAKSIPLAFRREQRKVPIPPHRMTPLKNSWPKIYPPLVEHLKLQVRMNTKAKAVELRTSSATTDTGALQKGEDFVKAFTLGFDTDDAIAVSGYQTNTCVARMFGLGFAWPDCSIGEVRTDEFIAASIG